MNVRNSIKKQRKVQEVSLMGEVPYRKLEWLRSWTKSYVWTTMHTWKTEIFEPGMEEWRSDEW